MSDLKYQTVEQLQKSLADCNNYIASLESKLAGQRERRKWIQQYIFQKTPKELTIQQIEAALGHKVIIK